MVYSIVHRAALALMLSVIPALAQVSDLDKQLSAEQAAKRTSEPEAVADSARRLAGIALLEMGRIREKERAWPEAAILYQDSDDLQASKEAEDGLARVLVRLPANMNFRGAKGSAAVTNKAPAAQRAGIEIQEKRLRSVLGVAFTDWGTAEARQKLYSQAMERFHEAERWDASTPELMRDLGNAAFRTGNYAESARALEMAVLEDPKDQQSQLMLGMARFSLEDYAAAAEAFAPVSALVMQDPRAASAWAYSLARTKQQEQANQIADKLTAEKLSPQALMMVCQIYNVTEDYKQAAECFGRVGKEDPSVPHTHYLVGAALLRLDRPNDAIPELRQELKLAPGNPDAQYYLAYALLETGHREEAEGLLKQVVSEAPLHAQAQYQLGKALLDDGDAEAAIAHLEEAVQLDPEADYMHYQLQTAYRRTGRRADADRELATYRELKAKHRAGPPQ